MFVFNNLSVVVYSSGQEIHKKRGEMGAYMRARERNPVGADGVVTQARLYVGPKGEIWSRVDPLLPNIAEAAPKKTQV